MLYLRQEGRGIGLYNKLDAYKLQLTGLDTYEANLKLQFGEDLRRYDVAAQMLHALNISQIQLLTNNLEKVKQLEQCGIQVIRRISTACYSNPENINYLTTKVKKSGHILPGLLEISHDQA